LQDIFEKVFMSIGDRLRSERENLGLSQPKFAAIAGTTKQTLFSWESGKTAPDGFQLAALAAAGVNVLYILTGEREGPEPEVLTSEERVMLDYFRQASPQVRRAALGALLGAAAPSQVGGTHSQHASGDGSIQIGSMGSKPTKRRG